MNKKGFEISLTMLATLLIAVVMISGIAYIFFKTNLAGERGCNLLEVQFLENLKSAIDQKAGPQGYKSRASEDFKVPCGERAYFVNLNKKDELRDSKALDSEPLIKDSVLSGADKNFFIMSGDTIAGSYNL